MKILFLDWNSFCSNYIKSEFTRRGYELVLFDFPQSSEDTRGSETLAVRIATAIMESNVDFVFSLNYFAVAAIAAKATKRKYISWTYDSPYIQLYSLTIEYPSNYAFVFDKSEYLNLKRKGVNTVYYLPMAGPADAYDDILLSEKEHNAYDSDIAMIGSMYTESKHNLYRHFSSIDDYTKGYIEALMNAQKNIYGASVLERGLTPGIVEALQKSCPMFERGDGMEDIEWVFANYFLARHLTGIERQELIGELAKNMPVTLYTPESTPELSNVDNRGSVDYYSEFAKVVKCTKVNLNISLRSIISGIPLRCFDIMAAGGFLLTTYQEDFMDYFEADKDYVFFENKKDLVEKARYYIEHDDIRNQIASNGYDKVKKYHNFKDRVDTMLSIAGIDII